VKKIAAAKPPKADPAPVDPKVKPTRKGREVSPNGLLAETFTIEAATQKLPDFAALTASGVFIAPTVDAGTTGPLAGAPATLKAPTPCASPARSTSPRATSTSCAPRAATARPC
jgi:hypothetical protein